MTPTACARAAQSWKELLLDLKRRGLAMGPELAGADGALGFWKAVEEVWPKTRGQRCWVHKTANVLNKLPKSQQPKAKRALQEIWMAAPKKDAFAAFDAFIETWGVKYDKAVECLVKDRDTLLAFYDFPAEHWKHLRTTNIIESSFATIRHRTVRSKGCFSNKTAPAMIFKARSGRREKLAAPQRSQPVAQTHSRGKVRRRNRGRHIASSSPCRLTPSVAKFGDSSHEGGPQ
jgi:putative transposase